MFTAADARAMFVRSEDAPTCLLVDSGGELEPFLSAIESEIRSITLAGGRMVDIKMREGEEFRYRCLGGHFYWEGRYSVSIYELWEDMEGGLQMTIAW